MASKKKGPGPTENKSTPGEPSKFTVLFSPEEREILARLTELRAEELREATGQTIEVSVASLLRWLVDREATTRGLKKTPRK